MELVENDDACRAQIRIVEEKAKQDARRDDEQPRLRAVLAVEADRVADGIPEGFTALVGDAPRGGAGGEAARLQDQDAAGASKSRG